MTDTIKISRELLERLYEASGRGDGMHTDDLRAVRALLSTPPADAADMGGQAGELWAVHAQGPDDIYPAFDRADAERHAAELNAIQTPPGISVAAVVIPSPLAPLEHWKGVAELEREHTDYAAIEAECDRLRAQVSALQSDANSWQSGYDKGREDGAKAADGWKAQHARDSAELRRLCAERDQLRAELDSIRRMAECGTVQNWLKLPEEDKAKWFALMVGTDSENKKLRAELSALKAQQVGQVPVGYLADDGGSMVAFFRAEEKDQFDAFCAEAEPLNKVALYTAPQPAPAEDVAQLPPLGESLRSILGRPNFACSGIAKHLRGMGYAIPNKAEEEQAATIHWLVNLYLKHGEDWATHANAALAAHDKQSGGEV